MNFKTLAVSLCAAAFSLGTAQAATVSFTKLTGVTSGRNKNKAA